MTNMTNDFKPVFYYSYENEERLNNGSFLTFEDAKESAIEQYKSELADLDEGDDLILTYQLNLQ